ncbi:hypothetical protein QUF64_02520 [Anaerolineales bacterium HSG6]|nr:hypothetical protein [Anaerolineales bacterium HSG6]MDM8531539.1 hypothetical protein [Anaerolineales bacterium HSG25]
MSTNQAIQNLILTYLEEHPDFLEIIRQKFAAIFDDAKIPMVDKETEKRIGTALENFKTGEYITVSPNEDILDALNNFDEQLRQEKSKRLSISNVSSQI